MYEEVRYNKMRFRPGQVVLAKVQCWDNTEHRFKYTYCAGIPKFVRSYDRHTDQAHEEWVLQGFDQRNHIMNLEQVVELPSDTTHEQLKALMDILK